MSKYTFSEAEIETSSSIPLNGAFAVTIRVTPSHPHILQYNV